MSDVGFTGSRAGMSEEQEAAVRGLLARTFVPGDTFHHGDCVGADAEAAGIAVNLGYFVVAHPPIDSKLRAYAPGHNTLQPKPYLDRNHDIVDAANWLIATPHGAEDKRSGTWATIRYARAHGVSVMLIRSDGTTK